MPDWIAWTRCSACEGDKSVFEQPDDAPRFDPASHLVCPKCGNPARLITFPAFDVQSFDVLSPDDAMYDTMGDW